MSLACRYCGGFRYSPRHLALYGVIALAALCSFAIACLSVIYLWLDD